jgi:ribosomal protein S14
MIKRLIRKDRFLRKQYNKFEIWNTLNKSLKKSLSLYDIPKNSLFKGKKKYSKTPIRNYCFQTGRSLGVVPFFRISRMLVREKAGIGLLPGIYKKS